jgi:hypothetical protein
MLIGFADTPNSNRKVPHPEYLLIFFASGEVGVVPHSQYEISSFVEF